MDPELQQFLSQMQETLSRNLDLAVKQLSRENGERLTATDARVTAMDTRVTAMDARVTVMDERVTAMDARVTAMDERVTAMDARVTAMEARIIERTRESLDEAVRLLIHEISTGRERSDARFEAANARLERQSGVIQAMLRGSARFEQWSNGTDERLNSVLVRLGSAEERLDRLEGSRN